MKHAFADRARWLADTDFVDAPTGLLTSKGYARRLAARLAPEAVSEVDKYGTCQLPEDGDLPEFQDVYLVKGDPASEVMLRRANVQFAYSAVVLADPADGNLADAKSILIAMAVRSVCSDAGVPKTYVCVEGVAPQNVDHLQRAGADEIVSASDFAMMLLSQSALSHGLGTVYRDLLTVSGETNEIYILPIPEDFIGKSFSELGAAMFQNRDPQNPVILIGAVRDGGILVNPQAEKLPAFSEGDKAVVIAFERPSSLV